MEMHMEKIVKKNYEKPTIRMISIADSVQVLGIGCKKASPGISAYGVNPCVMGGFGKCATLATS